MAKIKKLTVSKEFGDVLSDLKKEIETKTGKKISLIQTSRLLAHRIRKTEPIEKKLKKMFNNEILTI